MSTDIENSFNSTIDNRTTDNDLLTAFLESYSNKDMSFQFLELFPYMIAIFTQDGTLIYVNRAGYEELNITDPDRTIGKYNILKDSMLLDTFGWRENVERTFRGERETLHGIKFNSDVFDWAEPFTKVLVQSISTFPLWDNKQQIAYIAMVHITTQTYEGRKEIVKVLEYMDTHWKNNFDRDKLAGIANLSPYHFTRIFKQYHGITPHEHYKQIKIKKLCEMLLNPNMSVTQAFKACGLDVKGRYMKYFRESIGMTPSEYRDKYVVKK